MKRNVLLDIANTVCQMLYSRRLTADRDTLASLPAGTIAVDLLAGVAYHDSVGRLAVAFSGDFAAWLRERCLVESIQLSQIDSAMLTITMDPKLPHPTDFLGPFDRWSARCEIAAKDRTYVGQLLLGDLRPCFD